MHPNLDFYLYFVAFGVCILAALCYGLGLPFWFEEFNNFVAGSVVSFGGMFASFGAALYFAQKMEQLA